MAGWLWNKLLFRANRLTKLRPILLTSGKRQVIWLSSCSVSQGVGIDWFSKDKEFFEPNLALTPFTKNTRWFELGQSEASNQTIEMIKLLNRQISYPKETIYFCRQHRIFAFKGNIGIDKDENTNEFKTGGFLQILRKILDR